MAVFLLWEPVGSDAGAQPGVLLGWWFVFQLLHGVGGLGIDVNGGVAYWAHVGGFLFGLVAAWLLRGTGRDVAVAA